MPGKNCFGSTYNNSGRPRDSKAFCEGAMWRAQGTEVAYPEDDNPHESGSDANAAWGAGWAYADDAAPGDADMSLTCCAAIPTVQQA